MNSVELCRSWLKNGALFLDTETVCGVAQVLAGCRL
jgi:hypothetical protein